MTPPVDSIPTGRDVLVVEDESRLRDMLQSAITKMGFNVTLAPSSEAAQRLVKQRTFDILILDLNLPGLPGLDFLQQVRAQQPTGIGNEAGATQAIILTGFGDLAAARTAIHLDVVEFLTKPCALGDLEAALARAYSRRRGQLLHSASLPQVFAPESAPPPLAPRTADTSDDSSRIEDLERQHILATLEKNRGNRAATATELGISLRKLYYRLGEYQRKGLI